MVVYALLIINKAGGLIYQRDFAEGLTKLSINDYLVLAGTFHGVHAITTRLHPLQPHLNNTPHPSFPSAPQNTTSAFPTSTTNHQTNGAIDRPEPPTGIEVLESENFRLQCFSTLTGTKFLLFTEPQQPNVDKILARIYELYSDFVMKNPFYQLEMPVRVDGWERRVVGFVRGVNNR